MRKHTLVWGGNTVSRGGEGVLVSAHTKLPSSGLVSLCYWKSLAGGRGEGADLLKLHDHLCIGLAELVRGLGLAPIRATLLRLIIHGAQLSQQPFLAIQCCCHLMHTLQNVVRLPRKKPKQESTCGMRQWGASVGSSSLGLSAKKL